MLYNDFFGTAKQRQHTGNYWSSDYYKKIRRHCVIVVIVKLDQTDAPNHIRNSKNSAGALT